MVNKNVLVTGGAGFIGSNFIPFFLKENANYTVINLDKLTYAGKKENLAELENNNRHKLIIGDICNVALVQDFFKRMLLKSGYGEYLLQL